MRNYQKETDLRVEWIRGILKDSGASGIIFANSGGKDAALTGILCRMASENTLGVIMPCGSARNYGEDKEHALLVADKFGIKSEIVDLGNVKDEILKSVSHISPLSKNADNNISPRLRMIILYTLGQTRNCLVAGTGNKSEHFMGYFTKWGDGAYDFNPIADLHVREVYEFLNYLGVPDEIIKKAPSAGLYDGQTDEKEMGVTYSAIEAYMLNETVETEDAAKIKSAHDRTDHKRRLPMCYFA